MHLLITTCSVHTRLVSRCHSYPVNGVSLSEQAGVLMDASRDKVDTEDMAEAPKPVIEPRTDSNTSGNGEIPDLQSRTVEKVPNSHVESSSKSESRNQVSKCTMSRDATVVKSQAGISGVSSDDTVKSGTSNDLASALTNRRSKDVEAEDGNAAQVDHLEVPEKDLEDLSLKSVSDGDNSVFSDNPDTQVLQQHQRQNQLADQPKPNDQSENESEELDDIELIFTTDETCRDLGLQEDLVSITETETWPQSAPTGQPALLKYAKSAEGESLVCNGEKTSSVEEAVSSQSSSIDREESVDRFDESSSTRLNKIWSQCSVLVETDISKCGVVEEPDHATRHAVRRNTLAAPPTAYR